MTTCTNCGSTRTRFREQVGLWDCDSCRSFFTPDATEEPIARRYPLPIALPWSVAADPTRAPSLRLSNLFAAFQQCLRLPVLLLLSEFLDVQPAEQRQDRRAEHKLAGGFKRLTNPGLGAWLFVAGGLVKYIPRALPGGLFYPPVHAGLKRALSLVDDEGRRYVNRLVDRRNEQSHHSFTDEGREAAALEAELPALRAVLEALEALTRIEMLVRSGEGYVAVTGPAPAPAVEALPETADILVRRPDGLRRALYPLMLGRAEEDPDVLLFHGFRSRTIRYQGVFTSLIEAEAPRARLAALLEARQAPLVLGRAGLNPSALALWSADVTRGRLEEQLDRGYVPSAYQPRAGVEDVLWSWIDDAPAPAAMVLGSAGAGKSTLALRLAERALPEAEARRCVVLLLPGATLRGSRARLWDAAAEDLGLGADVRGFRDVLDTLDGAEAPTRLLLLLDAVNEAEDPRAVVADVDHLLTLGERYRRGVTLKVLLTSRATAWRALQTRELRNSLRSLRRRRDRYHLFRQGDELASELTLTALDDGAAGRAWAAYREWLAGRGEPHCPANWADLASQVRAALGAPLLLRVAHRAWAGVRRPERTSETELWGAWIAHTLAERPGLQTWLDPAIEGCLERGASDIDGERADALRRAWLARLPADGHSYLSQLDPSEHLESAGIVRRSADRLQFTHQRLAEVLMARGLRARDTPLTPEGMAPYLEGPDEHRGAVVVLMAERLCAGDAAFLSALSPTRPAWSAACGRALLGALAALGREAWWSTLEAAARGLAAEAADELAQVLVYEVELATRKGLLDVWQREALGELTRELTEGMLSVDPDNDRSARRLVTCALRHSDRLRSVGRSVESQQVLEEAAALIAPLVDAHPEDRELLNSQGVVWERLGDAAMALGSASDALPLFDQYLARMEALVRLEPGSRRFRLNLSYAESKRATALLRMGRTAESRAARERVLSLREALHLEDPDDAKAAQAYAWTVMCVGDVRRGQERREEALDYYARSRALQEALLQRHPLDARLRADLAAGWGHTGITLRGLGRLEEAQRAFEAGLRERRRVCALEPDNLYLRNNLGYSLAQLGSIHGWQGRFSQALSFNLEAVALRRALHALEPDRPLFRNLVADGCTSAGRYLSHLQRFQEAEERLMEGVALRRETYATNHRPGGIFQRYLAWALEALGRSRWRAGRAAPAVEALEEALALRRSAAAALKSAALETSVHRSRRWYLARAQAWLAEALLDAGALEEATPLLEDALATSEWLMASPSGDATYLELHALTHLRLARSRLRTGRGQEALTLAEAGQRFCDEASARMANNRIALRRHHVARWAWAAALARAGHPAAEEALNRARACTDALRDGAAEELRVGLDDDIRRFGPPPPRAGAADHRGPTPG